MGMWEPSVGPSAGDLSAQLAAANARIRELDKREEYLHAALWDTTKQVHALAAQVRDLSRQPILGFEG